MRGVRPQLVHKVPKVAQPVICQNGINRSRAHCCLLHFRRTRLEEDAPCDCESLHHVGSEGTPDDGPFIRGGGDEREGRLIFRAGNANAVTNSDRQQVNVDQQDNKEQISESRRTRKQLSPCSQCLPELLREMTTSFGTVRLKAVNGYRQVVAVGFLMDGKRSVRAVKPDKLDCHRLEQRTHVPRNDKVGSDPVAPTWPLLKVVFSIAGWSTRAFLHLPRAELHVVKTPNVLQGDSELRGLFESQCQKITRTTSYAQRAPMLVAEPQTPLAKLHRFACLELSHYDIGFVSALEHAFEKQLGPESRAQLQLARSAYCRLVKDSDGRFLGQTATAWIFEALDENGTLSWIFGGHMLADTLTKLPDCCRETVPAMLEALITGRQRTTYDMNPGIG